MVLGTGVAIGACVVTPATGPAHAAGRPAPAPHWHLVEALPAPLMGQALPLAALPRPQTVRLVRPAHQSIGGPVVRSSAPAATSLTASGIPITALLAYRRAADREHVRRPACGLTWPLLAGIGRVESDHGRFAGAVLHTDGVSTPRIIGIPLNGHGTALIRDTDRGRLDGDTVYDRAVGPMQFIPSTWAGWGVDADGNGVANPFDIFDAAAAAADYLCAAGGSMHTTVGQVRAIRSYNNSDSYIRMVMALEAAYAAGTVGVTIPVWPTDPRHVPNASGKPLPPVDPGHPRGIAHKSRPPAHRPPPTTPTTPTTPSSAATTTPAPAPTSATSSPVVTPPTQCPTETPTTSSESPSPTSASTSTPAPSTSPATTSVAPSPASSSPAASSPAPSSPAASSPAASSPATSSPAPSSSPTTSSSAPGC